MNSIRLRVGVVAALATTLWLTAGQGHGDVREFNVNGFCLRVDAAPESYKYFSRFAEMKSAPLFYIELGDYSILKHTEQEAYGGQKIGEPLVVPMNMIKSDPGPKNAEEDIVHIDENRSLCGVKPYKYRLVEIVDRDGTNCTTLFNSRYYVVNDQATTDRSVRVVCTKESLASCTLYTYVGSGWRLSASFPEEYIESWPDIRERMRGFFDDHLSECEF